MSAVQKLEPVNMPVPMSAVTPMAMLAQAVEKGMSPDVIDKLMGLADRWDASRARKEFDVAIANAKANIPVILKTATGHNSKKYADFASIARAVDPVLSRHGLAYRFRTVQTEKSITVTCILFGYGHAEENTLIGPPDQTGNKNAIQAIGSTLTYLQRYSLVQALGLAASEDDDGRAAGMDGSSETITDAQADELMALLKDTGSNPILFLKLIKLESLTEIRADKFADAVKLIKDTAAKRAARGVAS